MSASNDTNGVPTTSHVPRLSPSDIASLTDKVALVTGASSGLGRAITVAYASAGAVVVCADLTEKPPSVPILEETLKGTGVDLKTPTVELVNTLYPSSSSSRPRAIYVKCDVTVEESMEAAVAEAVKQYGRLDIMVNNAGVSNEASNLGRRMHETPLSVYHNNMAVNSQGVWLGHKYAIRQFLAQDPHPSSGDRGWVINLCSIMGLAGLAGASTYCASKGAVLQMTRAIALEYAKDRVHVNCICPGFVETSLLEALFRTAGNDAMHAQLEAVHPWGRLGRAEDIARAAVFLAGSGAAWMTGSALVVDGGYTAQ